MCSSKYNVADIMDELDNTMIYLRVCQSAINRNYLEVYQDVESVLGDINSRIQKIIDMLRETDKRE